MRGALHVRPYPVLERAVDDGVAYGWNRAHKHTDAPSREAVFEAITKAVMSCIAEAFTFDDDLG